MCLTCAIEEVAPSIDGEQVAIADVPWPEMTAKMREAVLLVRRLYSEKDGLGIASGGHLHVFVDDFNVDDATIAFHRREQQDGSWRANDDYWRHYVDVDAMFELCGEILDLVEPMSSQQRATVLAAAHYGVPAT